MESNEPVPAWGPVIEMPMFPLGTVLLPAAPLTLHIFEERYQQMLNHVLEADRRFGVVLITRGSEVGGGDVRAEVGVVAEVQEHRRFDDGRAAVACTGSDRFEVVEWLADAPYPRARLRLWPAEPVGSSDADLLAVARSSYDRLMTLAVQLGRSEAMPTPRWSADVEVASWQLAERTPCAVLDRHRVLSARSRAARLGLLDELLCAVHDDLVRLGQLDAQDPDATGGDS